MRLSTSMSRTMWFDFVMIEMLIPFAFWRAPPASPRHAILPFCRLVRIRSRPDGNLLTRVHATT